MEDGQMLSPELNHCHWASIRTTDKPVLAESRSIEGGELE